MTSEQIGVLQLVLLVFDGMCIIGAFNVALYYRRKALSPFVYFWVLSCIFLYRTFSDVCVILRLPIWWATLPIIRGLVFIVPHALLILWMLYKLNQDVLNKER